MADSFARTDLDTPVRAKRRSLLSMDGDAVGVAADDAVIYFTPPNRRSRRAYSNTAA